MTAVTSIPIRLATGGVVRDRAHGLAHHGRLITQSRPTMITTATTNIRISCGRIPIPAILITSSPTGDGTTTCEGPQIAS